ncbi:MAG: gliding motility-associated C-terminal domain-containing protein [Chitinophagaceae bacterium]|nr:gliding motility-associated C-terminal domain-containing protein [Chitinophagaceae bacterium]
MPGKRVFILLLNLCFFTVVIQAQTTCSTLGQNPGTAFPVCGTSTFTQQTVSACGGRSIPVPGCNDGSDYGDINPYWYKFTCFASGSLGFTITPLTLSDDYDWQIFDITFNKPGDVYTNKNLYVASNWSAVPGATGTTANANAITNCGGFAYPNKSKMPALIAGHQYLLLISHFTASNKSGYTLSFSGGTANITDPKEPALENAKAHCDGTSIILKLNKKMQCKTLASNGSDFRLTTPLATITGASAPACSSSFDMDSVIINLNKPLPPGTYSLAIKKGSDGNTLMDNCDRSIAENTTIDFTLEPVAPTPMDSIAPVACAPDMLQLVFKKNMRCNAIAANGSDFVITGTSPVSIVSASGNCNTDGLTGIINIQLSQPIVTKGNFTITLKAGNDGNTIIDECGEMTPAGQTLPFNTENTVSANFDYNILWGCGVDTIILSHNGNNDVNVWQWNFEDGSSANSRSLQKIYTLFGNKNATLIVSNGVCSDTTSTNILLNNELKADIEVPEFICPNDSAIFKDVSTGKIASWSWNFGNGSRSFLQAPPFQQYPAPFADKTYEITLNVIDSFGCAAEITKTVNVVSSCFVAIPSAFSPNNDFLNDYLYPLNAYKAENLLFRVYNVYGQKVFETTDRFKKWDGTFNGYPQRTGTYVWTLYYIHQDTRKVFNLKGTTTLIR